MKRASRKSWASTLIEPPLQATQEHLKISGISENMNESKNHQVSEISVHCHDCYHGRYELVTRDEEYPMTDGSRMVLPRVNYLRCMECGEELLTSESERYISEIGPPEVDLQALWEEYERMRLAGTDSPGGPEKIF